ncbi:MAG: hypothetical protein Q8N63_00365 [Nanoarchaeota archaeon]|nr:hypothetical protein [Nanoarchaeota archaeon]
MLPKWHALFGFVFAYVLYWFTSMNMFEASLIFLSSVLIDFDHYVWIVKRKGYFNLKQAYLWHKALPKNHKPIMNIFHTIEFIIFIFILTFFWKVFLYVLMGMLFHSVLDIIDIYYNSKIGCREFSLIRYLILNKKNPRKYL